MLMNKVETLLVTSPANRAFQRWVEVPMLRRLGGRTPGAHALEVGCGSGYDTKVIIDQFGAATVDAVDLDSAMVTRARRRLRRYHDHIRVVQGSADDLYTALDARGATYDAVFDFGIIHHVTNWRDAVAEVARVLRPGGWFYYLEVTTTALARHSYRRLLDHPTRTGSPPASSLPSSPATDSTLPTDGAPTSAATTSPASLDVMTKEAVCRAGASLRLSVPSKRPPGREHLVTLSKFRSVDSTLALLRDPYRFVSRRAAELGEPVFETRLLLRPTTCMTGAAAAGVFYDPARFQRAGAAPPPLQKTLFGQGGVQGLDGEHHRQRKAMFLHINHPDRVEALAEVVTRQWRTSVKAWAAAGQINLYPEVQRLLTRAVCDWAGVPLPEPEVEIRARQLTALFDDAGDIGLGHLRSRKARKAAEGWAADLIEQIRSGQLEAPSSSAASVIADHRESDGQLMAPRVAAVELLNVLRPAVATAVYITFVAHALGAHPTWRKRLVHADGAEDMAFVEEVRRSYPFFPAVTAIVRDDFDWHGHRFPQGRRVLLDLYGTNHDDQVWNAPDRFDPERFLGQDPHQFAFVPQGGGDPAVHHRCPGEPISTRLMAVALDQLTRHMTYTSVQPTGSIDYGRLPALPHGGFRIQNISPCRG